MCTPRSARGDRIFSIPLTLLPLLPTRIAETSPLLVVPYPFRVSPDVSRTLQPLSCRLVKTLNDRIDALRIESIQHNCP